MSTQGQDVVRAYEPGDAKIQIIGVIRLEDGEEYKGALLTFPAGPPDMKMLAAWDGTPYRIVPSEEYARLRALLSSSRGEQRWRTIDSAPKDGTWFLICRDDEGFDSYEIGCYEPLTHDRFEPAEGGLYRKVPVKILDHRGFNNFHRATHWMPLPAPPAVKEGEGV